MSGVVFGDAATSAVPSTGSRALFLDRDGVVNINHGYVHRAEDTDWVPGIFELCGAARAHGFALVVVTNQAGIARGLYSEAEFMDYTRWVHAEFARRGVPLLATYYCPHHPDAGVGVYGIVCTCRKPEPGMILRAADDLGLALHESILIGDQPSDIAAVTSAGVGARWLLGEPEIAAGVGATWIPTLQDAASLLAALPGSGVAGIQQSGG